MGNQTKNNDSRHPAASEGAEKRQRSNGRMTREKIVHCAQQIVAEQGTDYLSMDRVVKLAQISKGALMYHFNTREALVEAIEKAYAEPLNSRERLSRAGNGKAFLTWYLAWYQSLKAGDEVDYLSPLVALKLADRNNQTLDPVSTWWKSSHEKTQAECADPTKALLLKLVVDALVFHQSMGTEALTPEEHQRIVKKLTQLIDEL